MEKNIKNFNEFNNPINEGIGSFFSKTFKPGDLDYMVENIVKKIKKYFNIDNLSEENPNRNMKNSVDMKRTHVGYAYIYQLDEDSILTDGIDLYINDDEITDFVNKNYIKELYNFLDKKYKYNNSNDEKIVKKRTITNLKDKYSKYYYSDISDEEFLG